MMRILTPAFLVLLNLTVIASAKDDIGSVSTFVNKYCVSCHGAQSQEGDRRFDQLWGDKLTSENIESFHEILDRLNLADMPPEDAELQPTDEQRIAIAEKLAQGLAAIKSKNAKPQTVFRRLNRQEFDAAVRNVLGLEEMLADPTSDFPPDETVDHFRTVGDTLVLSDFLLTQYLKATGEYLDEAQELAAADAEARTWNFQAPFCRNKPEPDSQDRDGQYQHIRENATDKFGYLWLKKLPKGVPVSGKYKIRVKASAINRDHPYKDWIIDVPREDPLQMSIVAGDTRAGDLATNSPTDKVLLVTDVADDDPQWFETTAWLDRYYQPRLGYPNGPVRIKYMRHLLMRYHRDSFQQFIEDYVHIFHTMHPDYDDQQAPALLKKFLDEQERLKQAGKPYDVFGIDHSIHIPDAWDQFYREYQGPRVRVYEVQLEGPLVDESAGDRSLARKWFPEEFDDSAAEELIAQFATAAYRRPATEEECGPIKQLYQRQRQAKVPSLEALKVSYQAILCSPPFLYHRTNAGALSAHELASRLSFFLWGSPPDEQLADLARSGQIADATVLKQQTDRLLADPRSTQFIADFTDSWLQLDKLGTMLPNRVEHPLYFNERLEEAARTETRLFVADAIKRDADVSVFVDSDYSFLNASLARLYDVKGVQGHEFRRVNFTNRIRGGLLGHSSVLTSTANGIDTSPVLRGVWVMECLLGTPPSPPPPDIEPIEPDIRGAKTIREQLEKHRTVATCNNCHRRFDPPGFALESFDEIGRFRQNYMLGVIGEKPGLKVDPSGKLSSGEAFADIAELKTHLMKRLDLVTANIARKLLTQATGRIDDPADRTTVRNIQNSIPTTADRGGQKTENSLGMRTLIHQIIQSESFRR